jgi:hypothetical protein
MGRARMRARADEETMAKGSQKLDPSWREREKRRMNVVTMRI